MLVSYKFLTRNSSFKAVRLPCHWLAGAIRVGSGGGGGAGELMTMNFLAFFSGCNSLFYHSSSSSPEHDCFLV